MAFIDKNHEKKDCPKLKNSNYPRDEWWTKKPENNKFKECLDKKKSQNSNTRENNDESNDKNQNESQSIDWSGLHNTHSQVTQCEHKDIKT